MDDKLTELQRQLDAALARVDSVETERDIYLEKATTLTAECARLRERIVELENTIHDWQLIEHDECTRRYEKLRAALERIADELEVGDPAAIAREALGDAKPWREGEE